MQYEKEIKKSKSNVTRDTIYSLPWVMFLEYPKLLDKKDWAKCHDRIHERMLPFVKCMTFGHIDGRIKEAKCVEWFSWRKVFDKISGVEVGSGTRQGVHRSDTQDIL